MWHLLSALIWVLAGLLPVLLTPADAGQECGSRQPAADIDPQSQVLATTDGGRIHADVHGTGSLAVVLAHGGRFDKASWHAQARLLARHGIRAIAPDFRGYGDSTGPGDEQPLSAPLHFDLQAAVDHARAHGAARVAIIGASMGGAAAAELVAAQPQQVQCLVLLGAEIAVAPESLTLPKLVIVTRDDASGAGPRLPRILRAFERMPEPRQLRILEGSAHAQAIPRSRGARRAAPGQCRSAGMPPEKPPSFCLRTGHRLTWFSRPSTTSRRCLRSR